MGMNLLKLLGIIVDFNNISLNNSLSTIFDLSELSGLYRQILEA